MDNGESGCSPHSQKEENMKIAEIIGRFDTSYPNTASFEEKTRLLSELDGRIKKEIIDVHKGGENVQFEGYNAHNLQKELLVPSPFGERLYLHWLEAMVSYQNSEMEKYTNAYVMFNNAYSDFQRYYIRSHMPKGCRFRNFGG